MNKLMLFSLVCLSSVIMITAQNATQNGEQEYANALNGATQNTTQNGEQEYANALNGTTQNTTQNGEAAWTAALNGPQTIPNGEQEYANALSATTTPPVIPIACTVNCVTCDPSGTCTECSLGYTMANNSLCGLTTGCPANCAICYGGGKCIQASPSFFIQPDGTTAACANGCANCVNFQLCYACQANFSLILQGFCYLTSNLVFEGCSANCATCASVNGNLPCVECDQLSYIGADTLCHACSTGCANCHNDTSCDVCLNGFQLTSSGTCQSANVIPVAGSGTRLLSQTDLLKKQLFSKV